MCKGSSLGTAGPVDGVGKCRKEKPAGRKCGIWKRIVLESH